MNDFKNYYIAENILDWDGQLAIVRLIEPQVFVRFNYLDSLRKSFEDWRDEIVVIEWLSGTSPSDEIQEEILVDCWNFLALHEDEEDRRYESGEYDDGDD